MACGQRKNAIQSDVSHPSAALVDDFSNYKNSASTNINSVSISGNLMTLGISYSGGCEKHSFELLGSRLIQKSLPPKRGIILYHNSNGDSCRELVTEELIFDIRNLSYDKSEIILILEGYADPISYRAVD